MPRGQKSCRGREPGVRDVHSLIGTLSVCQASMSSTLAALAKRWSAISGSSLTAMYCYCPLDALLDEFEAVFGSGLLLEDLSLDVELSGVAADFVLSASAAFLYESLR